MTEKRKRDTSTVSSWSSGDSSKKKAKHNSTTTTSTSTWPSTKEIDTSKPTAVFQPTGPRTHTLSVALPGSIIANAKSHDQKTFLCGTIARALAVFCVDEVQSYTGLSNPSHFLAHVLSYLETPPYLRKALFPMHANLRTAGTLPSLDLPSHVRGNEWSPTTPREEDGFYWGYSVRVCASLSGVLTECPFDGGYDTAAANDAELVDRGITARNVGDLFDYWVNLVPGQGSRTIRTEEAVWLGLMGLRGVMLEKD
ncbi:hypothetical protein DV736_g6520, partial [Chaetothyriales sp. CBS 134916]